MRKINIDELLFRCHSSGDLMNKTGLGETGNGRAIKTYIQAATNRQEDSIKSKYLDKGIKLEGESIKMLSDLTGNDYSKNVVPKKNDYFEGECDLEVPNEIVIDIKNSWDIFTFEVMKVNKKDNENYEWQGRCYMELYDAPEFSLVYTLLSSTIYMVNKTIEKEAIYNGGVLQDYERLKMANNRIFDKIVFEEFVDLMPIAIQSTKAYDIIKNFVEIPREERIHIKTYKRDADKYTLLTSRVNDARNYLKTIYQ